MKYHYQIINKSDPTDIVVDSRNLHEVDNVTSFKGYDTYEQALMADNMYFEQYDRKQYRVVVIPVDDGKPIKYLGRYSDDNTPTMFDAMRKELDED